MNNLTCEITFDAYTSYPSMAGVENYYVCRGSDSRQPCCAVSDPCVHHDPHPEVRKRVHLASLQWRADNAKRLYDQARIAAARAEEAHVKAQRDLNTARENYGMEPVCAQ